MPETVPRAVMDRPDIDPFPRYLPQQRRRDEAIGGDGFVTPAWSELFRECNQRGAGVLSDWRAETIRISRERGLAYRPEAIEGEKESWTLDPIPWIYSAEDWSRLETGLSQRLRLYAEILDDLYGAQTLLDRKLIPGRLVLGNQGFLRSMHDLPPNETTIGLGMSAFDISKDIAGGSFVLNDRFDCPYGLGLALENRTVVNKVMPDLFRKCQVLRIGYFFSDWFEYLASRAPGGAANPRIAILDDIEKESSHSEISFLANYCGIPRISPQDLTVRDARVWLKALSGLERVDVLWKAKSGRNLDPLESNHYFPGGISGLFESMRAGNVAVASHPGCELLQSPGFYPFLPKLCRELLGEELLIPPVATWWCGDPKAKARVLGDLSRMVVKSVGHPSEFKTRYGRHLTIPEQEELRQTIEANPENFVGQEELTISTIPASTDDALVPRGGVIRAFGFIDGKGSPKIMPGGLGRVGTEDGRIVSTRDAGESKDIWVRSHMADAPISIAQQVEQSRIMSPKVVPSRTGENLYWAGRNAERADTISRFARRIITGRVSGFACAEALEAKHEKRLVKWLFSIFEVEQMLTDVPEADAQLELLLRSEVCPIGVASNLQSFRRTCYAVQERWSRNTLITVERAHQTWFDTIDPISNLARYETKLAIVESSLAAFTGWSLDSMTRDKGWALLDAGRRIERLRITAGFLLQLLKQKKVSALNTLLNESLLVSTDSLGTYQSRFLDVPQVASTLRLLLGEEDYPRSFSFGLERLHIVLTKLPDPARRGHPTLLVTPMIEALNILFADAGDSDAILHKKAPVFLKTCLGLLDELHDRLTKSYFSHAGNTPE